MTQEEKQLLIKELCLRSQHGVKVWRQGGNYVVSCIDIEKQRVYLKVDFEATRGWWWDIEEVKLYLRPMSSMTKEEEDELYTAMDWYGEIDEAGNVYTKGQEKVYRETFCEYTDWLDRNMFDYRGLIPMGLALEAKEGMYNV